MATPVGIVSTPLYSTVGATGISAVVRVIWAKRGEMAVKNSSSVVRFFMIVSSWAYRIYKTLLFSTSKHRKYGYIMLVRPALG